MPARRRHPVFVALAETIREFDLPRQPLADLLVAFRRDQVQTRYETLADLLTYCEKSANPVGRIVLAWADRSMRKTCGFRTRSARDCNSPISGRT